MSQLMTKAFVIHKPTVSEVNGVLCGYVLVCVGCAQLWREQLETEDVL